MKRPRGARAQPRTGVDDFFGVLKSYGKVIGWAFGAAVVPLAAGLIKLAPPWPPAILQLTALFEVLVLVLAFQTLKRAKSSLVSRLMAILLAATVLLAVGYLILLSGFVYEEPISGERFVKGFACTDEARRVFPGRCPAYGDGELRQAQWDAWRLWQPWSITVMRVAIVALWTSMFACVAGTIGSFLVYQSGVRARTVA